MIIDTNKCIGCTLCKQDCPVDDIKIIDKKSHMKNITCVQCGHCIAICPVGAISCDDEKDYSMNEVKEYNTEEFSINPDILMNFMKFRRSVRLFSNRNIEEEKINKILEAGKFTQTGGNLQDVSYVVVESKIQELRKIVLQTLNDQADNLLDVETASPQIKMYANMWKTMYQNFMENPDIEDKLFYKAPLIIVVKSKNIIHGALAASKMELIINSLGLGTYFSGFLSRAANFNPEIGKFLQINDGEELVACLVIGYPKIHYKRTVPRKDIHITRL